MKLRKNSQKAAEAPIETAINGVVSAEEPALAKAMPLTKAGPPATAKLTPQKRTSAAIPVKTDDVTNGSLYDSREDSDHRRALIAEAAYFRAANRGFENGSPEHDWLEAEAEVEANLAKTN
ncbi:MAG: DUF2934 domain-containing protein [Clostridia bacterium]|nr:DUF2934 domain-containing protein [Deltaproteobacteria bacterium]